MRKLFKGIYCLAVIMLTLGLGFLIPAVSARAGGQVEDAVSADTVVPSSSYADQIENGTMVLSDLDDEKHTPIMMGGQWYLPIYDKADLATLSYNFAADPSGDHGWWNRNYVLMNDIDLAGSLWTPIGYDGYDGPPFQGVFNGNYHTISNITISKDSALWVKGSATALHSYAGTYLVGLFGGIGKGGVVANLTIKGFRYTEIEDYSHCQRVQSAGYFLDEYDDTIVAGAVAAMSDNGGGKFINVYHLDENGKLNNSIYPSLALQQHDTQVYRGGSRDGVTAHYTTREQIDATFTVGWSSGLKPGYALNYDLGDGAAHQYYSQTEYNNKNYAYNNFGTLLDENVQVVSTTVANYAPLQTRATAMANRSGAFVINPGYEYVAPIYQDEVSGSINPDLFTKGLVWKLGWKEKNHTVELDYGYAGRYETFEAPNDKPWNEALPDSMFVSGKYARIGYNLTGKYTSKFMAEIDLLGKYAGSYYVGDGGGLSSDPLIGTRYTVFLGWEAKQNGAYTIKFRGPADDDYNAWAKAIVNAEINGLPVEENPDDDILSLKESGTFTVQNHTSDDQVVISFELNDKFIFQTSGNKTGNDASIGADAGVYLRFLDGEHDTYNDVRYSITTQEQDNNITRYIVTIDHVVSSTQNADGDIVIAIQRPEINITLETQNLATTDGLVFVDDEGEEVSLTSTRIEDGILYTRLGEDFNLLATAAEGMAITEYNVIGFINSTISGSTGGFTDGVWGTSLPSTYLVKATGINFVGENGTTKFEDGTIIIKAGSPTIDFTLNVVHDKTNDGGYYNGIVAGDENPTRLASAGVEGVGNTTTDTMSFKVNLRYGTVVTDDDEEAATADASSAKVRVFLRSSDYYTYSTNTLIKIEQFVENQSKGTTEIVNDYRTIGFYNGYVQATYSLDNLNLSGVTDLSKVSYAVTFYTQPQKYGVRTALYLDGEKIADKDIEKYASVLGFGTDTIESAVEGKPGDEVKFNFTSGGTLAKYTYFDKYEVVALERAAENGGQWPSTARPGGLSSSTYTFGTQDAVINVYLKSRQATLSFTSTANVQDVNGEGGTQDVAGLLNNLPDAIVAQVDTEGKLVFGRMTDGKFVALDELGLGNIDIALGYYFFNWYIQNGNTVLTKGTIDNLAHLYDDIMTLIAGANSESSYNAAATIQAAVQQKTITIKFTPGANANGLVYDSTKSNVATAGDEADYVYYFGQELAQFGSKALSIAGKAGKYNKVGTSGLLSWKLTSLNATYLADATFQYLADWEDVWGNEDDYLAVFEPYEWQYIEYSITIKDNKTSNTYTVYFTTDETLEIALFYNGSHDDTYGEVYSILKGQNQQWEALAAVAGYRAKYFTVNTEEPTKVNAVENADALVNEKFVLNASNLKDLLPSAMWFDASESAAFEITTTREPLSYRIYIDLTKYETLESELEQDDVGYYVMATYAAELDELWSDDLVITRSGYKVYGFRKSDDSNATFVASENPTYKYTTDIHVKPVWIVDDGNVTVDLAEGGKTTVWFDGTTQELQTAVVSGTHESERIVEEYWYKSGDETTHVSTDTILRLKNVADAGTYYYVAKVRDAEGANLYTQTTGGYSYVVTKEVNITINQNEVVVKYADLKSYFTGTEKYLAADGSDIGKLYYRYDADGNDGEGGLIGEGIIASVAIDKIVDNDLSSDHIAFSVGTDYTFVYAITFAESNASNFTTPAIKKSGEIVETELVVKVGGNGLYIEGQIHEVKNVTITANGLDVSEYFDIKNVVVRTKNYTVGIYNTVEGISLVAKIYLKGSETLVGEFVQTDAGYVDRLGNFTYDVDSSSAYTIKETNAENAYIYNFDIKYLTASEEGKLDALNSVYAYGEANYKFRITEIYVKEQDGVEKALTSVGDFNSSLSFYTYANETGAILTITGNNTNGLSIAILRIEGMTVRYVLEIVGDNDELVYLGLQAQSVSKFEDLFVNLAKAQDTSHEITAVTNANYNAILTDVKAVTLDNGNGDTNKQTIYVSVGNKTGVFVANPTWDGFSFAKWSEATGVTTTKKDPVEEGETDGYYFTVTTAGPVPATVTGEWTLVAPTTELDKQEITVTANANGGTISLADIIGNDGKATNYNRNIDYSYAYTSSKDDTLTADESGNLLLDKISTDNEDVTYTLTITANYGSQPETTAEITFTLKVERLVVSSFTLVDSDDEEYNSDAYKYAEFNDDIYGRLTLEDNGTHTYAITDTDDGISFKVTNASVAEFDGLIVNKGTYTITLVVDESVYKLEASNSTQEFEVTVYNYNLRKEDIQLNLSKVVGLDDPSMENVAVITDLGESITVTLTREEGDTVKYGDDGYDIISATTSDANYNIIVPSDNKWFKIEPSTDGLYIMLKTALTMEYNGKTPTNVEVTYSGDDVETGVWTLRIYDEDEGVLASAVLDIYYSSNATQKLNPVPLDETYKTLLDKKSFQFGLKGASKNAGKYELTITGSSQTYTGEPQIGGDYTEFEITKATITVNKVEKYFDGKATFTSQETDMVDAEGLVKDDVVIINGEFVDEHVGNPKAIKFITLDGIDAKNYNVSYADVEAKILAANATVNFTYGAKRNFYYGDIAKTLNGAQLLAMLGDYSVTIADFEDVLASGYLNMSVAFKDGDFTESGRLKASDSTYTLVVTFSSTDFNLQGTATYDIENIKVSKLDIDLSASKVSKAIDGTTDVKNAEWDLHEVLDGDQVTVTAEYPEAAKTARGEYQLTITLGGRDGANYFSSQIVKGKITEALVTLTINDTPLANDESLEELKFVKDDENVSKSKSAYELEYPQEDTKAAMDELGKGCPTRVGYKVTGWAYKNSDNYVAITEGNVNYVLGLALEAAKAGKTFYIYAIWEIQQVTITVDVAHGKEASGKTEVSIEYFTETATFTFTGDEGYKFKSASLSVNKAELSVNKAGIGSRTKGSVTLSNVKADLTLNVEFEEIVITVNVDRNLKANTNLVSDNWGTTQKAYAYSEISAAATSLLPTLKVTAGTYTLTGWTYGSNQTVGAATLLDIVKAFKNLSEQDFLDGDVTIDFTAQWQGVQYTIYFSTTEGEFTDGVEGSHTITARYGEAMTEAFPEVASTGREVVWYDHENKEYKQGDTLYTIGTDAASGVYTLTFHAVWSNATFKLTVVFADHITSVVVGNSTINSGKEYSLVYSKDTLELTVTTEAGYSFTVDRTYATVVGNKITVSNLSVDNYTLTITAVPNDNVLTVTANNVSKFVLEGSYNDDEVKLEGATVTAKTGKEVTLKFTAKAGYTFDATSIARLSGGAGVGTLSEPVIGTDESGNSTMTITWSGFTTGATLTVGPTANSNLITVKYGEGANITSVEISTGVSASGSAVANNGTYSAKTGTTLYVTVYAAYGYKGITLALEGANDEAKYTSGEEVWVNGQKVYRRTFEVTGFTKAFTITLSAATAREYDFSVISDNPAVGTIDMADTKPTVAFGGVINLKAKFIDSVSDGEYIFVGWYINGTLVATNIADTFTLDINAREVLESATDGVITIRAKFSLNEGEFTFEVKDAHGTLTYEVDNSKGYVDNVNSPSVETVKYGSTIVITVTPDDGYEILNVEYYGKDSSDPLKEGVEGLLVEGVITIEFAPDFVARVVVSFTASDAYIKVRTGVSLNYQTAWGTAMGGTIWPSKANGDKLTSLVDEDEVNNGTTYTITTKTDAIAYFVIDAKDGYGDRFSLSSPNDVIINRVTTVSDKVVYSVTGIIGTIDLQAVFAANDNTINIYFVDVANKPASAKESIVAGRMNVRFSDGVTGTASGTGADTSSIKISTYTQSNATITVTAYTNLAFTFARYDSNVDMANSDGINFKYVASGLDQANTADGNSEQFTLTISEIYSSGNIYIYVTPKVYSVALYDGTTANNFVGRIKEVKYGTALDLSPSNVEGKIIPSLAESMLFLGYFTEQLGAGNQYIDANGDALGYWMETGYVQRNGKWEINEASFTATANGGEIKLYADWYYDREKITLDFVPDQLKTKVPDLSIGNIVTSLSGMTTWSKDDEKRLFYAEVITGQSLRLSAYNFEGYTFQYWEITRKVEGKEPEVKTYDQKNYTYTSASGEVTIKAVYFANYEFTVVDDVNGLANDVCGRAYLKQTGIDDKVSKGAFDTEKFFSIVAVEGNKGYRFVGWRNALTGEFLRNAEGNINKGEYTMAYDAVYGKELGTYTLKMAYEESGKVTYLTDPADPIYYEAVFEGAEVGVRFDLSGLKDASGTELGNIASVRVDGEEVENFTSVFQATVGATITIDITLTFGYDINWNGLDVEGYGPYTYVLKAKDLASEEDTQGCLLVISPVATADKITYSFELSVREQVMANELSLVGSLTYSDENQIKAITSQTRIENKSFSDTWWINTSGLDSHYKIYKLSFNIDGRIIDIYDDDWTENYESNDVDSKYEYYSLSAQQITIKTKLLGKYKSSLDVKIIVTFTRVLWTDNHSDSLIGSGTSADPYLIASAQDLAFVAYAVELGLVNEGLSYADAYYMLIADINLSGKYWVPIGTEDNPFGGTINLNGHTYEGITHYMTYTNPTTSYEGLMWHMKDSARIIQIDNTWIIAVSVVGGLLLLLLIIIIILVVIRRRRRKKLEELSNS